MPAKFTSIVKSYLWLEYRHVTIAVLIFLSTGVTAQGLDGKAVPVWSLTAHSVAYPGLAIEANPIIAYRFITDTPIPNTLTPDKSIPDTPIADTLIPDKPITDTAPGNTFARDTMVKDTTSPEVTDVGDVIRKLLKKKPDPTKSKKERNLAILPSLGYNPSFGFVFGAKASAIKQFGDKETTDLSAFGLEALYTSKGIITAQVRHNIFTPGNKFNFIGNWQVSKFLITDYNVGTGNKDYRTDSDSTFLTRFNYVRLTERIFRKVGRHLFAGIGVSINYRDRIDEDMLESLGSTPHERYSARNGFSSKRYSANALIFATEYNSREHPIRSYGGTYADFNLAVSQTWIGSTKNALQFLYDLRKYISLSNKNPEHVLAFWHMASYKLDGDIPYLALQATGYDLYNRSGRGYTIGRFKGPMFAYFETEYRFPITRNKLISGVAFINFQTASDDLDKKLFDYIDHAAGEDYEFSCKKTAGQPFVSIMPKGSMVQVDSSLD